MNPADGPYAGGQVAMTALGRFGTADEVASTVAYLAAASYVTGAGVRGGRRARGVSGGSAAGTAPAWVTRSSADARAGRTGAVHARGAPVPSGRWRPAGPGGPAAPFRWGGRSVRGSAAPFGGRPVRLLAQPPSSWWRAARWVAPSSVSEPNRRRREMPPSGKMSTRAWVPTAASGRTKRWLVGLHAGAREHLAPLAGLAVLHRHRRPAGRVALQVGRVDLDRADLGAVHQPVADPVVALVAAAAGLPAVVHLAGAARLDGVGGRRVEEVGGVLDLAAVLQGDHVEGAQRAVSHAGSGTTSPYTRRRAMPPSGCCLRRRCVTSRPRRRSRWPRGRRPRCAGRGSSTSRRPRAVPPATGEPATEAPSTETARG